MTNNTNTLLSSCAKHDCNTNPTRRPSSSSSSEATTQPQLSQTMLTVFSMLHFFMSLTNYIELGEYYSTCRLLYKFKKYTNYKLNYDYSLMYYQNETFRTTVLSIIANPLNQLYLKLNFDSITKLTIVGRISRSECYKFINGEHVDVYDIDGCDIITKCRRMVDLSALKNVYYLKIISCCFLLDCITNLSILKDITMLDLSCCWNIKNANSLKNVRFLSLSGCWYIKNANGLNNVRVLDLSGCGEINDISNLGNVDTLDLRFCNNISPLSRVRVLDLSYCKNITNVCALENVSVLNLTSCTVDVFILCELQKKSLLY